MAENNCQKWNKAVTEASCNICKDQCDLSIANPDHFIAKKLIVDLELVKYNRKNQMSIDSIINDMDLMIEDIEDNFREKAVKIIDNLGLTHLMFQTEEDN